MRSAQRGAEHSSLLLSKEARESWTVSSQALGLQVPPRHRRLRPAARAIGSTGPVSLMAKLDRPRLAARAPGLADRRLRVPLVRPRPLSPRQAMARMTP